MSIGEKKQVRFICQVGGEYMKKNISMEKGREYVKKIMEACKKTGYGKIVLLVLAAVLLLLLSLPGETKKKDTKEPKKTKQVESNAEETAADIYVSNLEQRLEQLLRKVQGVGEAEVMITLKTEGEEVINKDERISEHNVGEAANESIESSKDYEEQTVVLEDSEGNQNPYIVKELKPEIAGVVVICEGGDNPVIIKEITDATEVLFSVSTHKIKVMKKK